jgi:subtilisin family serine protease
MRQLRLSISVLSLFLLAVPLFAKNYVLTASKWTKAQSAEVAEAKGLLIYWNSDGFGLASSTDPSFESKTRGSRKFAAVVPDFVTQWTHQTQTASIDAATLVLNTAVVSASQWVPASVNAPAAWQAGFKGQGVRVAVIDGGIYDTHVDLQGAIDFPRSRSFVPGFNFNQDTGMFWHGTHVAGIIAARDNGIGITGVAPEATIIGIKALHDGSGGFGEIIAGIYYAATPINEGGAGAHIINLSVEALLDRSQASTANSDVQKLIGEYNKAIDFATRKGVMVICAAGNDSLDLSQERDVIAVPAELRTALAISATGPNGFALGDTNFRRPAQYSNFGDNTIWLAGPGGNEKFNDTLCPPPGNAGSTVLYPCPVFDRVLSTVRGPEGSTNSYWWEQGTSMAAPAVAGVAALAKQAHPGIKLADLKKLLVNTADDEGPQGPDAFYGFGFPNAAKAVQ